MKFEASYNKPNGKRGWRQINEYEDLPAEYTAEIGAAASAYTSYIKNLAGGATGNDPAYTYNFSYKADGGGQGPLDKGEAKATNLLYSQVRDLQRAGLQLLDKLLMGADMEIASGQRK